MASKNNRGEDSDDADNEIKAALAAAKGANQAGDDALSKLKKDQVDKDMRDQKEGQDALDAARGAVQAQEDAEKRLRSKDKGNYYDEIEFDTPLLKKEGVDSSQTDSILSEISLQSKYSNGKVVEYDNEQFVWDQWEINQINKHRSGFPKLPVVHRSKSRQIFGIRANRNLNYIHCIQSIFWPNHNEFISILFYIGFSVYFWVQTILISCNIGVYSTFKDETSSLDAFFVTFVIAISFSVTTTYLVFYPIDLQGKEKLEALNLSAIYLMAYSITFVFVMIQLKKTPLFYTIVVTLSVFLVASIILVYLKNKTGRIVAVWGTLSLLVLIESYDLFGISGPRQKEVFHYNILLELSFFVVSVLFYLFQIPERCCINRKCPSLYLNSYIIMVFFYVNFIYEIQNCMVYLIKLNEGSLSETDQTKFIIEQE